MIRVRLLVRNPLPRICEALDGAQNCYVHLELRLSNGTLEVSRGR